MSPEEKKAAEIDATMKAADAKKRKDAAEQIAPEKEPPGLGDVMSKLDALCGNIKSIGERMDAFESKSSSGAQGAEFGAADDDGDADGDKDEPAKRAAKDSRRHHRDEYYSSPEYKAAMASAQSKNDRVACLFNVRSERPMVCEDVLDYRKRLLRPFVEYSDAYKKVDVWAITDPVIFDAVEAQVYADATAASSKYFPNGGDPDQLFEVKVPLGSSGQFATEFRGQRSFVHALKPPAQRVMRFNTERRNEND